MLIILILLWRPQLSPPVGSLIWRLLGWRLHISLYMILYKGRVISDVMAASSYSQYDSFNIGEEYKKMGINNEHRKNKYACVGEEVTDMKLNSYIAEGCICKHIIVYW